MHSMSRVRALSLTWFIRVAVAKLKAHPSHPMLVGTQYYIYTCAQGGEALDLHTMLAGNTFKIYRCKVHMSSVCFCFHCTFSNTFLLNFGTLSILIQYNTYNSVP